MKRGPRVRALQVKDSLDQAHGKQPVPIPDRVQTRRPELFRSKPCRWRAMAMTTCTSMSMCMFMCTSMNMFLATKSVHGFLPLPFHIRMVPPSSVSQLVASAATEKERLPRPRDVRFDAPLLLEGYPPTVLEYESNTLSNKPLLIYLPGFDGTWLAPFLQFPELSTEFDVRCLSIGMSDRSTLDELRDDVIDYILHELTVNQWNEPESQDPGTTNRSTATPSGTNAKAASGESSGIFSSLILNFRNNNKENADDPNLSSRPVYLMGESFGGILASEIALTLLEDRRLSNVKGLVLINAATCYDRSKLASEGPKVANVSKLLYPFALLRLLPLFTDEFSLPQLLLLLQSKALPSVIDTDTREAYMGRFAFSLPAKLFFMPQATLQWRLSEWLEEGCSRMATKLSTFQSFQSFPILVVAGENDKTLPSIAEAERLLSILPNCQEHVVEGAGHASTCGSRVDLAALMRGFFPDLSPKSFSFMQWGRGNNNDDSKGRTAMKPVAAEGKGVNYGLEPRYNGKEEGLSPLLYWSNGLYRKWKPRTTVDS